MKLNFWDEIPIIVFLKKRASELLILNMVISIIACILLVKNTNTKNEEKKYHEMVLKEIDTIKNEIYIPRKQLRQFRQGDVEFILASAKALENSSTSPERFMKTIDDSDRVSRELILQGLSSKDHFLLYGMDDIAHDNKLPSFREMQWNFILGRAVAQDKPGVLKTKMSVRKK